MTEHQIAPSSVTKPIQLLAAWLVGLLALNASFLTAAATISHPEWAAGFLVVCAALNVPLFLVCLFLLQTKFRPEMQEDQFYARYLERRVSVETGQTEVIEVDIKKPQRNARVSTDFSIESVLPTQGRLAQSSSDITVALNDLLPKFGRMQDAIKSAGFSIATYFGSTSFKKSVPPYTLLSISHDVSIRSLQRLLRALDGSIDWVGPANQSGDFGHVYVGSYSYEYDYIPKRKYDPEVRARLLSPNLDRDGLIEVLGWEPIEEDELVESEE